MIFIVLAAMALGVLFGFLRGFKRSIVKLSASVLAAVLAFVFAILASNWIVEKDFLTPILSQIEAYNELANISPTLLALLKTAPVALITPILFLVIYWVLKIFFAIPCFIINKVCKFKRKNETKTQKLLGLPLGAAQGLVSLVVLLFVVGGYFNLVDKTMKTIDKSDNTQTVEHTEVTHNVNTLSNVNALSNVDSTGESAELDVFDNIKNIINNIGSDPVMSLFSGGKTNNFVFERLTQFELDGEQYSLTNEVVNVVDAAMELAPLLENSDTENIMSDEQISSLKAFTGKVGKSGILKSIAAEVVSAGGEKWAHDEEFMGISFTDIDARVKPIIIELFNIMSTTNTETIENDINVIIEILDVFNRYEVMETLQSEDADFMKLLNSGFSTELMGILNENERFTPIASEIKGLSVGILSSALKAPEITEEQYDEVSENVAEVLNKIQVSEDPEEAKEELKTEIFEAANTNGVEVSEEVADIVAEAIDEIFAEHEGEFTKETVQNYFEEYAAKYGFTELPVDPEMPEIPQ